MKLQELLIQKLVSLPGIFSAVIGLMLISISQVYMTKDVLLVSQVVGISLIVFGVAAQMFTYLKVNKEQPTDDSIKDELSLLRKELLRYSPRESVDSLLNEIRYSLKDVQRASVNLSQSERDELLNSIKDSINNTLTEEFLNSVEEKYGAEAAYESKIRQLRVVYGDTRDRLGREVESLTRRANINLIIGSLTTFLAAILLVYIVLGSEVHQGDLNTFVWHYVPRLFVVIFIEVFSFFFLRLYKSSLSDIKYFQNEITNIDSKSLALETALMNIEGSFTDRVGNRRIPA